VATYFSDVTLFDGRRIKLRAGAPPHAAA